MKSNKLFSMVLAASLAFSAFATIASADQTITNADVTITKDSDGYYYLDNGEKVSERTPYIETEVTLLSSAEVSALTDTSFSSKNLKKYANADNGFAVYKVTGTFKNIGTLMRGYDAEYTDDEALLTFTALDATINLGDNASKIEVSSPSTEKEAKTGYTWSGGIVNSTANTIGNVLQISAKSDYLPTAEGIANVEPKFTDYIVVKKANANDTINLSYSNVSYVMYAYIDYDNKLAKQIQVKVADNSDSFKLAPATVENKWTFTKSAVTENLKDNNKLWKLDVAKSGTPGDITSFGVTFTGKNGSADVSTTRNIKASTINAAVADWNTATSFYVGLNNKSGYTDIDATFSGNAVTGTTVEFK